MMKLHCVAGKVLDVAASEQEIAFAAKEMRAGSPAFASFYCCDWETLQLRPVPQSVYLQLKFGPVGLAVAQQLGEVFTCRSAPLPDGGCAVLCANSELRLFRPDGGAGARFLLEYNGSPAGDIAVEDGALWFTAPQAGAVVQFSLAAREPELRVGGTGVFVWPRGLARSGRTLLVCCTNGSAQAVSAHGPSQVKPLHLPSYDLGAPLRFAQAVEKYFKVFRRGFAWAADGGLYACEEV
jgi:hypothetical protein